VSCPSEERLSIYVDAELPLGEVRSLESHIIQCRRCRATILALRDEVAVLSDVLHDRTLAPAQPLEPRERARGLVVGLVPTLGVAALVVTVGAWLLETSLPAGTAWLSPIRLMGAYDMVFDTIFVLRDRAPALFELAIAVGALFGTASILTFLVGSLGKRLTGPGLIALAVLGAAASVAPPAEAFDVRTGEKRVVVEAGETITETLIVSAESLEIDGRIEGDLVVMAESIRIEGEIDGNVVLVGDQIDMLGDVDDALFVAGKIVRIEGEADDLYAFSEDITLDRASSVERDATVFGERVRANGPIGRDLFFGGDRLEVRGPIGRDVMVRGRDAALLDGARVARNLDLRLRPGSEPQIDPGVEIGGERIDGVLDHRHGREGGGWTSAGFYLRRLVLMISAFLVGMGVYLVRPGVFQSALPTVGDFVRELGLGFATVVLAPVSIVLCFATVVGIPLGVITLFAFVTGLFVSMILVAALVGSAVLRDPGDSPLHFGRSLLLGLLIVVVAVNLPFVGWLVWMVALLTGAGMLVSHVRDSWRLRGA
jgi:hypothetical protein